MKYWSVKVFWFVAVPIRKLYWFIFRPQTRGVKSIIQNGERFLLVKLNYAHKMWTLPGGRVGKNESMVDAAYREVFEETGIEMRNAVLIGFYTNNKEYKQDVVEVYLGRSEKIECIIDPIEIKEAKWFVRGDFPQDLADSVYKCMKFYDEYKLRKN